MMNTEQLKLEVSEDDFNLIKSGKMKCAYVPKEYGDDILKNNKGNLVKFNTIAITNGKKKPLEFEHATTNMVGHGYVAFHGSRKPRKFLNDTYRVFLNPITNEECTTQPDNQAAHAAQ